MTDELNCPHCGKRMRYDFEQEKIRCKDCDYSPLDAVMQQKQAAGPRQRQQLTHRGEINANALAAFNTAHDYLYKGDSVKAQESFKRALFFQADFADAHLALAEIAEDEKTKREHLGTVLAFDGSNPAALRQLMVLNGRLTKEQAAQTHHHNEPKLLRVDMPVAANAKVLLCPVCSGNLTTDDVTGRVECRFCGHVAETNGIDRGATNGSDSLAMALLERKASSVKWVIGERLLHCNECGADRTLSAKQLSNNCPFCDSTHVIMQDALGSFEQPDGLVPFRISRQQAADQIKQALEGVMQRLANLFDNNRVKSGQINGLYLPFWVFDALADVTVTRIYKGSNRSGNFAMQHTTSTETFSDGLYDVIVSGVTSPSADMVTKISDFDLKAVVPYDARMLAKYPAELYSIDFDKASLEGRSIVSHILREKHRSKREMGDEQMEIRASALVHQMSFRLLLLPVWVANLTEQDGDVRPTLVNGQTGKVALGKAQKQRA